MELQKSISVILKKTVLAAMSGFLVYQSYLLISGIDSITTQNIPWLIAMGWVINMFITGIFAFAGFGFPTQKLLPNSIYKIRNPNLIRKLYRLMRVDLFRRFLLSTLWLSKKKQSKFFDGKKGGIQNLIDQSRKAEFGHGVAFLLINILVIYIFSLRMYALATFTLFWNILGNFYPMVLQRHHRMRISAIEGRKTRLKKERSME